MIFPIVAYGDPVLRKVARPVEKDEVNLPELVENMYQTMYDSSGIGLAAPQIGQSIRLFVVDGTPLNEDEKEEDKDPSLEGFKKVFINPEMLEEVGDEWAFEEGCLSIPGIRADVYRPDIFKNKFQFRDTNLRLIQ